MQKNGQIKRTLLIIGVFLFAFSFSKTTDFLSKFIYNIQSPHDLLASPGDYSPGSGNTYYVSVSGSDLNIGTESAPWRTITKAAETMVAGDTVYIMNGTYNELVRPSKSGEEGKFITYMAYPGHAPIIDAQHIRNQAFLLSEYRSADYIKIKGLILRNGISDSLLIAKKNHIIVEDVEVSGATKSGGIYVYNSNDILLDNIYAHHNEGQKASGVLIGDKCNGVTIRNSHAEYNGMMGFSLYSNGNYDIYPNDEQIASRNLTIEKSVANNNWQGIWVTRGLNVLVKDNETYANGVTGIQIETGTKYIYVVGNTSYANNRKSNYETGIWIDEAQYGVVENNIIYESQKGLYISQSHSIISRNNIIFNNKSQWTMPECSGCPRNSMGVGLSLGRTYHVGAPPGATNNRFVHNTLYDNGATVSEQGGFHINAAYQGIYGNRWINNIVANSTGKREIQIPLLPPSSGSDWYSTWKPFDLINNNLYYNTRSLLFQHKGTNLSFSNWKTTTGFDTNSVTEDPFFTDPQVRDFSLKNNSPAIDRGGWLAYTTQSGSGKVIPVDDPYVFSDGMNVPGVQGDLIQLQGSQTKTRVADVDYTGKTISVEDSISWENGQGIAYSYSSNAPDIGAIEFEGVPNVPINGSCSQTLNTCTAGTFSDMADTDTNHLWQCLGLNGGTNASCSLPKEQNPINGSCSTTLNTCSAGTFSDMADTDTNHLWQCLGLNGGTNASCSLPKDIVTPVNGICSTSLNQCTKGVFSDTDDSSTNYLWKCEGQNGGTTASCSLPKNTPINGSCSTTLNTCTTGAFFDTADSSTNHLWSCNGLQGGTNASCSLPKTPDNPPNTPIHASCSSALNTCASGTFSDVADTNSYYFWNCNGQYGGSSVSCSLAIPYVPPYIPIPPSTPTGITLEMTATSTGGIITTNRNVEIKVKLEGTLYDIPYLTYTFYCDRNDSTTDITTPWNGRYDKSTFFIQTHNCSYQREGTYTPKVVIDFYGRGKAEGRLSLNVRGTSTPPPPTTTTYLTKTLVKGERGTEIVKLQRFLIATGHLATSNDTGFYGPLTDRALIAFKTSKNIPNTTQGVDTNTKNVINVEVLKYPHLLTQSLPPVNQTPSIKITQNLFLGSRGNQVIALQQILVREGLLSSSYVTGYYGYLTQRAVKSYQLKYKIGDANTPGFGNVGPKTRTLLNR
ncbi:MAG: right-handed parallel beta-helix repeat-containing protein [Magnetococcus sp. WYHC-3]